MEPAIAIMQPYFFPYIGYFQLINAVNKFVFYDDVNFIKRGWINRNKILINNQSNYFTIPCKDVSQNKLINQIGHALNDRSREKLLKKVSLSYRNAPFFNSVFPIIEKVVRFKSNLISDLAIESVETTCNYLKLHTSFEISSKKYNNRDLDRADRLIDICNIEGIKHYINPESGKTLYEKSYFSKRGITLSFLKTGDVRYKQFQNDFIQRLSIIDVMMFNSPEEIRANLLPDFKLI